MGQKMFNFGLGHHIIGTEETINNITRETLIDFKKRFYGTDNVFLLVVSSAKSKDIFKSCKKHLKGHGMSTSEVTPLDTSIFKDPKDTIFTHPNIQQSYLTMMYNSSPMNSNNSVLDSCLRSYLGGGLYGILGKVIREELGLCYHIFTYEMQKTMNDGVSAIYVQLDPKNVQLAKDNIIKTLQKIVDSDTDADLYYCAKAQMLSKWCVNMDDPSNLCNSVADSVLFDYELDIESEYHKVNNLTYNSFNKYAKETLETILKITIGLRWLQKR